MNKNKFINVIASPILFLYRKMKKYKQKKNVNELISFYQLVDSTTCNQELPIKNREIVFVLPYMPTNKHFGGGMVSILRLSTGLFERGYKVKYVSGFSQDKKDLAKALESNYNYKGEAVNFNDLDGENRFICATSFATVFFAIKLKGYKLYFVQDFEPFFFPMGDQWYLANKTYKIGLHLISLGKWNLSMINRFVFNTANNESCKNFDNPKMDWIDFPFEPKEFSIEKRDYAYLKNKKVIKIAVYSRSITERRMPALLRYITGELKNCLSKDGYGLQLYVFGDNIKFEFAQNLGVISRSQMKELFSNCDFGMCMSGTNVSLVPYEMIASGLPLIDFENSSLKDFLNEGVFYYSGNINELYEQIKYSMQTPKILDDKMTEAQNVLKKLSWDRSIDQFDGILKKINE